MAKFAIECPHCGAYNNASTSIFASKKIECKCGKIIDVKIVDAKTWSLMGEVDGK